MKLLLNEWEVIQMNKNLLLFFVVFILGLNVLHAEGTSLAVPEQKMKQESMKKMKKGKMKVSYKCEHCNVSLDHPGKCSSCGMDLKKVESKIVEPEASSKKASYSCTHCNKASDKPGQCCGMEMKKI